MSAASVFNLATNPLDLGLEQGGKPIWGSHSEAERKVWNGKMERGIVGGYPISVLVNSSWLSGESIAPTHPSEGDIKIKILFQNKANAELIKLVICNSSQMGRSHSVTNRGQDGSRSWHSTQMCLSPPGRREKEKCEHRPEILSFPSNVRKLQTGPWLK